MTPRALKAWRLRLDLSQDGLARWLGVSRSTVNRWEGGLAPIPHMLALVKRHYYEPGDIDCDCVEFKAICDYHGGGRYRTDAEADHAWATAG